MAIKIPIITELQDEGIRKAKREFDKFKGAISEAEGTVGKFQAGGKAAFDALASNATTFALAGVSAFATFAAKGVSAFQDLALQSDKFATATGLAVDQASRLIEVAGDVGIEAGSLETAIGKMNQNLGKSPDLFEKLGVQIKYADDGTIDVNETFLNTIDRLRKIKDPAERAKTATELLGKGWRDMANLISMGSEELRQSLATVSEAKTISPEEAAKAKKFRDTMDKLGDTVGDLSLKLGEVLVPVLEKAVDVLNSQGFKDFFSGVGAGIKTLWSPIKWANDQASNLGKELRTTWDMVWTDVFGGSPKKIEVYADALRNARQDQQDFIEAIKLKKIDELTDGITNVKDALWEADTAWKTLTDQLDTTVALDTAKQTLSELETAAAKAFATGADSDIVKYNEVAANFAGQLAAIAEGLDKISNRDIKIRFDTQGPAAALALAAYFASGAELKGLSANQLIGQSGFSFGVPGRASGGPVTAGGTYLVGERGPELLTMGSSSGYITPNGAGSTINVTVTSADPNAVVRALQTYVRQSGPVPVNTRAM